MPRPVDELDLAPADELAAAAEESLWALRSGGERVAALASRAAELDGRARELAELETRLTLQERALEAQTVRLRAAAADTEQRNEEIARAGRILEETASELSYRENEIELRAVEVAGREARFASRWRFLLRALRFRPALPGRNARICELLFVPSPEGYKLLEQDGLALRPGAVLTGLLGEEQRFRVTKIAPWAFDGRWCAYLQAES